MPSSNKFRLRIYSNFNGDNNIRLSELAFRDGAGSPQSTGIALTIPQGMSLGSASAVNNGSTGENLALLASTKPAIVQFDVTVGTVIVEQIAWSSASVVGNVGGCPNNIWLDYYSGGTWVPYLHWIFSSNPWTAANQTVVLSSSNAVPDISKDVSFNSKIALGKSVSFNSQISGFQVDFSFDAAINLGKSASFDFALEAAKVTKDISFDAAITLGKNLPFDFTIEAPVVTVPTHIVGRRFRWAFYQDWGYTRLAFSEITPMGVGDVNYRTGWTYTAPGGLDNGSLAQLYDNGTGNNVILHGTGTPHSPPVYLQFERASDVDLQYFFMYSSNAHFNSMPREWALEVWDFTNLVWIEVWRWTDAANRWTATSQFKRVDIGSGGNITKDVSFDYKTVVGKSAAFDFKVLQGNITKDASFDYAIKFGLNASFDFKIDNPHIAADASFDYAIALGVSASFDYGFVVETDYSFDFAIDLGAVYEFDFGIDLGFDASFDYSFDTGASFDFEYAVELGTSAEFQYQINNADVVLDAGFDYAVELGIDAGFDYGINLAVDASFDYGFNIGVIASFDYGISFGTDAEFDYEIEGATPTEIKPYSDLFTVSGAWGLRRLVSGYNGPLVRVRDTVTNVETDLGIGTAGMLESFTGSPAIVKVYDQSGWGADLGQTNTAKQPLLVAGQTIHGGPVIRFDGVDDFLVDLVTGTARPYMTANIISAQVFSKMDGAAQVGNYAGGILISAFAGADTSPYKRWGWNWGGNGINFDWYNNGSLGFNIGSGQNSPGLAAFADQSSGKLAVQSFSKLNRINFTGFQTEYRASNSSDNTYPATTALYIAANGAGLGNLKCDFVELAMGSNIVTNDEANVIVTECDKIAAQLIFRDYELQSIVVKKPGTNGSGVSAGEIELLDADLFDLTTGARTWGNTRYNTTESWEKAFDDDHNTLWSAGGGDPWSLFGIDIAPGVTPSRPIKLTVQTRNDGFYIDSTKTAYVGVLTKNGWQYSEDVVFPSPAVQDQKNTYDLVWIGEPISKDASFDYQVLANTNISLDADFRYAITLGLSADFDYKISSLISTDAEFDYKIELGKSADFTYQIVGDAATYRYHRVFFTLPFFNSGSDAYVTYAEIDLRDAADTRLVGTASASSAYYPASNAQDGNPATAWGTDGADGYQIAWYQLDLGGSPAPVAETLLLKSSAADSEKQEGASALYYTVSNDAVNWELFGRYYNNPMPTTTGQEVTFDSEPVTLPDLGEHRYWGIRFISNEAAGAYTGLGTLRFRANPFTPNIPTNTGTAGASSVGFGAVAANAFDNDVNTQWGGATGGADPNAMIWYDFGAGNEQAVGAVMFGSAFSGTAGMPLEFDLICSDDGATWLTAKEFRAPEVSLTPWVGNEYRVYDTLGGSLTGKVTKDAGFDYEIEEPPPQVIKDCDFAYGFQPARSFSFDYRFDGVVTIDVSFDYSIPVAAPFAFAWAILETSAGVVREFVFDYQFVPEFENEVRVVRMPVETPVVETWGFASSVIVADDGTEQRAQMRECPRVALSLNYLILDDADRRVFMADFLTGMNNKTVLPMWQYGTRTLEAVATGAADVQFNPEFTDIRGGDYLYYLTPQALTGGLTRVLNVVGDRIYLAGGFAFDLPKGSWLIPCRRMRLNDGLGPNMSSIAGTVSLTASSLDRRELVRPGALPLVSTFDGLPVLDRRPLANDPVDEQLIANAIALDLAFDASPELFNTFRMTFVSGTRKFQVPRLRGLDFWRDFANRVGGQARPFLVPSYREDFEIVGASGDVLTVAEHNHLVLTDFVAYSRVAIKTASGLAFYKIISAVADGDVTQLTLDRVIVGTPLKVSYLLQSRLASDNVKLTHTQSYTEIAIDIRTTNE